MKRLPLITPHPPRLSEMTGALQAIEASGLYSNNGPVLRAFEADATKRLFGGRGACLAVCLLYTSPSPRDRQKSRMPSSA